MAFKRPTTRQMSDAHEKYLADIFDGILHKGSGNQFNQQMDGATDQWEPYSFAWDGKATFAESITIPLEMWSKAEQQAHFHRPMLALRFYANYRLSVTQDLVVVDANDMAEILEDARKWRKQQREAGE